jgi:hypothetical protein
VKLALAGALAVALLAAAAASASTPAAYRAKLNGICRSYTPTFKSFEAALKKAEANKDGYAYGVALGKLIGLGLRQDRQLESVPVPSALTLRMRPILKRLRTIDVHLARAVIDAAHGDPQGMLAEVTAVNTVGKPLNHMLDTAGLRDCGSNQP